MLFTVVKNKELMDKMSDAMKELPLLHSSSNKLPYFAFCQENEKIVTSKIKLSDEIDTNNLCKKSQTLIGLFFVQPYANAKPPIHVISRDILKGGFLDENLKVICSGYNSKNVNIQEDGKWDVKFEPKLLCVSPKIDANKSELKKTIKNLDTSFDVLNGFNPKKYIAILKESFEYKRKNL
jgi:hypothetical protein